MRAVKTVLIVISILLIALNGLSYLGETSFNVPEGDPMINKVAYYIGRNMGFIIAGLLLIASYILGRVIRRKGNKKMVDSLFNEKK